MTEPDEHGRRELARACCGLCAAEGRKRPAVIGTVRKNEQGAILWVTDPTRPGEKPAVTRRGGHTLSHPLLSSVDMPEYLRAWCRHHGELRVPCTELSERRGTFVLSATKHNGAT